MLKHTKTKKVKRAKVATVYVVKNPDGRYFGEYGDGAPLTEVRIFSTRGEANTYRDPGDIVIPCRIRVLTSKKRNAKRNG